jgi:hypothetical protein
MHTAFTPDTGAQCVEVKILPLDGAYAALDGVSFVHDGIAGWLTSSVVQHTTCVGHEASEIGRESDPYIAKRREYRDHWSTEFMGHMAHAYETVDEIMSHLGIRYVGEDRWSVPIQPVARPRRRF